MGRTLTVGNPPIAVDLRASARARRLSLRVSRLDGTVSLTVPRHAAEHEALAFLREREGWLRGHLADVAAPQMVAAGAVIPYRGERIAITPARVPRCVLDDGALLVPQGRAVAGSVKAFLQATARDVLAERSDHHAARVGRRYSRLVLRDTRSRWGSCSSAGQLMYSWRLIMAPPAVLDYVAAHEVAHLVEMNHAPAFWAVVARLVPDHAAQRAWLRRHGNDLHRVRFA